MMKEIMDTLHTRNACDISLLLFLIGPVAALAAPAMWVQSVSYGGETF
jgi:hypothetical protein